MSSLPVEKTQLPSTAHTLSSPPGKGILEKTSPVEAADCSADGQKSLARKRERLPSFSGHRSLDLTRITSILQLTGDQKPSVKKQDRSLSYPGTEPLDLTQLTAVALKKKKVRFTPNVLMQQAITDGNQGEIEGLVCEFGLRILDEPEPSGISPAMRCVFESQLEALKVLVDAGADLTAQDGENWTVLHVAASMDDLEAAKFVLNQCKQCLTHVRNVDGERAIDLAESTDMARLLLEADLRSHETTSDGENAILVLVRDHHAKNGDCQALDAAMQSGTSYDSLLHLAAGKNYPLLASYLLRHRLCRLEARGKRGRTALHTAAYFNNIYCSSRAERLRSR
jgi:hypothetical protein